MQKLFSHIHKAQIMGQEKIIARNIACKHRKQPEYYFFGMDFHVCKSIFLAYFWFKFCSKDTTPTPHVHSIL